jgi:MarR family transcriptional regulator for hemolysin
MTPSYERDLLFLLHDVARMIRVEADKRARSLGMTRAQWALLLRLENNPGLSQKEVACLLEVEPISIARLVDRLEAKGLIERRADSQDRRKWRLHICPKARDVISKISTQREALIEMVAARLPALIQDQMIAGLTQMKANLLNAPDQPGASPPGAQLKEMA